MQLVARDYQIEAVNSIYRFFSVNTGNPVIAMPTGTGKSVVIALFLESIYRLYPQQKVIVVTHVKELIEQNHSKLMALWPQAPSGIYSAGLNQRDTVQKIIFAGIASISKRASDFGHVDLLIVDEAHLVSPSDETMYVMFIACLKEINPNLKIIGLTATPWRLGHGKITQDGIFTDICFDITTLQAFNRLIAEGYIAPLIPKKTRLLLDTTGVHLVGGEFNSKELQTAVDKDEITFSAIKEAIELGQDRKHWLCFASGIKHAIHIADTLNMMGISAVAIHSKMSTKERDAAIEGFKQGKYRCAVNQNILTTGFDFPEIDMIIVLRPTQSVVLWIQMLGRGTRPAFGKTDCLVLDFANNTKRLGPINDPVIPRKKGEKGGDAPVKCCEKCSCWNHASVRVCAYCGEEFKFVTKLVANASSNELIAGDMPIVELFEIEHITFQTYKKLDRPPMMLVTYFSKFRMFKEFICFEHEGFAGKKAREWWRLRSNEPIPVTVDEALARTSALKSATHLRVWINKKYPEIMATCFDGTAFGTKEQVTALPTTNTDLGKELGYSPVVSEDDIPF